jgi:uncharacterized membrane protein
VSTTSDARWRARDKLLSALLIVCVLVVWIWFRG